MKTAFFIVTIWMLNCYAGLSQPISFQPLRYNDDFSWLKQDTGHANYRKIKYIPFGPDSNTYISLGGEVRLQYFYVRNEDWADQPQDRDGYILSRYLFHSDFHFSRHSRVFLQTQSSLANGKEFTSPVDENPLELHQAFFDFVLETSKKDKWTFRVGRQELSYGSQRLISVRELPNNRQSFDGLKTAYTAPKSKLDLFYTWYVRAKKGIFDDAISRKVQLWGAYFSRYKLPILKNVDLYYLGVRKQIATFDNGEGKEVRHSFGSRIWGRQNKCSYDIEGVYQTGKLGKDIVSAWTASANISFDFPHLQARPTLGFKTEIISGDRQYNDGRMNTFNPLFPRGSYFGMAALIGPSNLVDFHPYIQLDVAKKISIEMDVDVFWRHSSRDGIYGPDVKLLYSGSSSANKYIGKQLSIEGEFVLTPFFVMRSELTWFDTGPFLKQATSGKDILLAGVTLQLKF
jgi:hypothetical protein